MQLPQPMLNGHCPDIADVHLGPMWPYPSFEEFPVNRPRRVRMPVRSIRKFSVNVMIDEVPDKNELFSLPIAIPVD